MRKKQISDFNKNKLLREGYAGALIDFVRLNIKPVSGLANTQNSKMNTICAKLQAGYYAKTGDFIPYLDFRKLYLKIYRQIVK